jgi:hypothetical protein
MSSSSRNVNRIYSANAPKICVPSAMTIGRRLFSTEPQSEKVKKITEELLTLSTLEMNQLILAMQVRVFRLFCFISDFILPGAIGNIR